MWKASWTQRALLTTAMFAIAVSGANPLQAQEAVLEEVIVTGSRIARPASTR